MPANRGALDNRSRELKTAERGPVMPMVLHGGRCKSRRFWPAKGLTLALTRQGGDRRVSFCALWLDRSRDPWTESDRPLFASTIVLCRRPSTMGDVASPLECSDAKRGPLVFATQHWRWLVHGLPTFLFRRIRANPIWRC